MGALAGAEANGDMNAGIDEGADADAAVLGSVAFAIVVGVAEAIAALGLGVAPGDMAEVPVPPDAVGLPSMISWAAPKTSPRMTASAASESAAGSTRRRATGRRRPAWLTAWRAMSEAERMAGNTEVSASARSAATPRANGASNAAA
jgi:hypothetical protein